MSESSSDKQWRHCADMRKWQDCSCEDDNHGNHSKQWRQFYRMSLKNCTTFLVQAHSNDLRFNAQIHRSEMCEFQRFLNNLNQRLRSFRISSTNSYCSIWTKFVSHDFYDHEARHIATLSRYLTVASNLRNPNTQTLNCIIVSQTDWFPNSLVAVSRHRRYVHWNGNFLFWTNTGSWTLNLKVERSG